MTDEPVEVTHRCPPTGSQEMPCCGLSPFAVPPNHRITVLPSLVTCEGLVDRHDSAQRQRDETSARAYRERVVTAEEIVQALADIEDPTVVRHRLRPGILLRTLLEEQ